MKTVGVSRFRDNLKALVEDVAGNHELLRVRCRSGDAFVVMSEQDWQRERETLYVLQNTDLMQQIANSMGTWTQGKAYQPTAEQMDEILGV